MTLFPGFGGGGPKKPDPLPDPVKREDPEIELARKKTRLSEKRRKGRRSSILTSASGAEENLGSIKQAGLGGAQVLG